MNNGDEFEADESATQVVEALQTAGNPGNFSTFLVNRPDNKGPIILLAINVSSITEGGSDE